MKKKILIIGESDSVYIKEYIEYMLKTDDSLEFTVLVYSKKRYLDFYKKHHVRLIFMEGYQTENFKLNTYQKFLIGVLKEKFDYIHVQAVFYNALKLAVILAGKKSKVIASFWAYPTSKQETEKIGKLLKRVNKISFVTESLRNDFWRHYGHQFDKRISCMDLVMSGIEKMKKIAKNSDMQELQKKAKRDMGFDNEKIVIAIGYCGRKDQQHLKVMKQLELLSDDVLQKIHLFLHISYAVGDESYIRQIEGFARRFKKRGCICEVSREYMEGKRLAYLRYGVDIFVNAEIQDVLSATMLEYFCGGTTVLNAKWLDYQELDNIGIEYEQFTDLEELPIRLIDCIENVKINKHNAELIWEYWSWENRAPKWKALYTD